MSGAHNTNRWIRAATLLSMLLPCLWTGCTSPRPPSLTQMYVVPPQGGPVTTAESVNKSSETIPILTLAKATELAIAASPLVAELTAALDVALWQKHSAWGLRDPELRVGYGEGTAESSRVRASQENSVQTAVPGTLPGPSLLATNLEHDTSSGDSTGYRVSARFFPPNPWMTAARLTAAEAAGYAAQADLAAAQWAVSLEVRKLYAEAQYREEDVQAVEKMVALHAEALKLSQQNADTGSGNVQDVMMTSRRYLEALATKAKGQRDLQTAHSALASLVNLPAEKIRLPKLLSEMAKIPAISISQLEQNAIRSRADLAALFWRTKAAEAAWKESQAADIPWFNYIEASFDKSESTEHETAAGYGENFYSGRLSVESSDARGRGDRDEWAVEASVNVPLFSWMNHDTDVRRAQYKLARTCQTEATKRLGREIAGAFESLKSLQAEWKQYRETTTPLIKKMESVLSEMDKSGTIAPSEIARLRAEILQALLVGPRLTYESTLAVINLEQSLGTTILEAAK